MTNEQAIVVLVGGIYVNAREYAKDVGGISTLQRNKYAAFLYKQTGLPLLVSGGNTELGTNTEASVMIDTLKNSFNVGVTWQEDKARNTAENAIYSAALLKKRGLIAFFL